MRPRNPLQENLSYTRLNLIRRAQVPHLSQSVLAGQVGCSQAYLSGLETAKVLNPPAELMERIKVALNYTECWEKLLEVI